MIQPPRVLPSNAPPLSNEGNDQTSRVLQEHSGNRQQTTYPYSQSYGEQKYAVSRVTENTYPAPPVQTGYQLYPQPTAPTWSSELRRSGFARGTYGRKPGFPSPAEKAVEAKKLYRRFLSSDQYAKYRQRQHKDDKGSQEQKWPDHLEEAFFRALVEWPPMGRRKLMWKDKQRGRNELIADCIESLTGVNRTRKQVSSHIQVLKPFVEEDGQIMRYLSKEDLVGDKHFGGAYSGNYAGGRMSRYPVTAPPRTRADMIIQSNSVGRGLERPEGPSDFEMFVQRKYRTPEHPDEDCVERLHTYTKHISQPWVQDHEYYDWNRFATEHPFLATMHQHRPLECIVISANASLAIAPVAFKDSGVELGISFRLYSAVLDTKSCLTCHNAFYVDRKLEHSSTFGLDVVPADVPADGQSGGVSINVKFGSIFWASALSSRYREALARDAAAGFIGGITATQEIFVAGESGKHRIMAIHWSFRLSTGERGRTSWQRIKLPPPALKAEQVDTPFNFNDLNDPLPTLNTSTAPPSAPALQSPFTYDGGSGSALSSATWPTSASDDSGIVMQCLPEDYTLPDNAFDFTGGNIDITYDPNFDLNGFDTSTFNFDAGTEDFVANPALQDYSQPWADVYASGSFDTQHDFGQDASFATGPAAVEGQVHESHRDFGAYDPRMYATGQDAQAYGGAGQESIKEEDPMAVLADASFVARPMSAVQDGSQ